MNKFIARIYSEALEFIHLLFLLGMIIFTLYAFSDEGRLSVSQIMLVYAAALGTWIVIFGFITTIVVMAGTLIDIKEQNRAVVEFLQEMVTTTSDVMPETPAVVRMTRSHDEPFLVSGDIRR